MTAPCDTCGAAVRAADLLVRRSRGNVDVQPVAIDAQCLPADLTRPDQLLLCLGKKFGHSSAVVVHLDDPGTRRLALHMPKPHAHRLHVCPGVPSSWSAQSVEVGA